MKIQLTTFKAIAIAGFLPLAAFGQTAASDAGPTDSSHTVTGTSSPVPVGTPMGSAGQAQGSGAAHNNTSATTITGTSNQ